MSETDALVLTLLRELDEITVADRIRQATDLRVQETLDAELIGRVAQYVDAPDRVLALRLVELEEEWEIERVLTVQSSATALTGLLLSVLASRKWLLLTLVTSGFLLQHSLQGWCPPLELHRRLGYRTRREIDLEIQMLKLIRGDYQRLREADGPTLVAEPRRA